MENPENSTYSADCVIVGRKCANAGRVGSGYEKVYGECKQGFLTDLGRTCGLVETEVVIDNE